MILPEGYLAGVYAEMRAEGALCVADEVQCGFGRVGRAFWGFELQGVVPDIVTCGELPGRRAGGGRGWRGSKCWQQPLLPWHCSAPATFVRALAEELCSDSAGGHMPCTVCEGVWCSPCAQASPLATATHWPGW